MNLLNLTSNPTYQARIMENKGSYAPHMLGWDVPPEELVHIPEHWLQFPEPEYSLHVLLAIVYVFLFFASTIGNGLVIWVFSSAKSLRTASNMFVVNLAICDFIMMAKTPINIYNSMYHGYALGHFGCQIFSVMGAVSGIGASMTNACIAYDRFTTITRPFDGKITRTKAFLMISFVWIYTMPWTFLPLSEVWGRFVPEGYLTTCTFDYLTDTFDTHLFVACIFTCSYVFPMSAIVYFYSKIVGKVFSHEKALREQAKKMNVDSLRSNQNQQNESAELRIAKAAITVCFLFVCSWTPYAVLALIGSFGNKALLTPGVSMIPALTCKFVAVIDPYIYAISHPRYRMELQKRLPWLAIKEGGAADSRSNATEVTTATTAT